MINSVMILVGLILMCLLNLLCLTGWVIGFFIEILKGTWQGFDWHPINYDTFVISISQITFYVLCIMEFIILFIILFFIVMARIA